jgi:hypothetical protein
MLTSTSVVRVLLGPLPRDPRSATHCNMDRNKAVISVRYDIIADRMSGGV